MQLKRTTAVLAGISCLALAVTGCSSSKKSSSSSGSSSAAATAAATTTSAGSSAPPSASSVKVGMAYDVGGRGDHSFNDLAAAGLDKAKTTLGVKTNELAATQGETEQSKESRLTLLAQQGYNPVVAIGFAYSTAVGKVVPKFPKTHFAIIDDAANCTSKAAGGSGVQPNVSCLLFTEEQSSYLVGVAAGLATKTKNVGFIGGVNEPLIQKFQAGFQAGVKAVNPTAKVQATYLSQPPDFTGFNDPAKGKTTAQGMYDNGADVVYAAAGGSGAGLFQAALADKKLAIGVDSDQYTQPAFAKEKSVILTSALKGVDTAVYNFISADVKGKFKAGTQRFDLKAGGVGYSTSNPAIKPYEATINKYKAKIISGAITVPTKI